MARFMGIMERSKRFLLLASVSSTTFFERPRSDDVAESMYVAGKTYVQTFVALNHLSVECLRESAKARRAVREMRLEWHITPKLHASCLVVVVVC